MDTRAVTEYVARTKSVEANAWSEGPLRQLAGLQVPREILGVQAWLLEADVKLAWTRWYVDGLLDRTRFLRDRTLGYSHVYSEVRAVLRTQNPTDPIDELNAAATAISELAWDDIVRARDAGRRSISPEMREELWVAAEPSPRCYLCGYLFTSAVRDQFLGREDPARPTQLPVLIDFTRPRLSLRDYRIEVDHVAPVAGGGPTVIANLRLACGWCNRVKSDKRSLLDTAAYSTRNCVTGELGIVAVPQPLWVLRIVATRGRCEHPAGCSARLDTHELFIAARNSRGAVTPVNAMVVCRDHDPWVTARRVGRGSVQR